MITVSKFNSAARRVRTPWPYRKQVFVAYAISALFIFIDRWPLPLLITAINVAVTEVILICLNFWNSSSPGGLIAIPIILSFCGGFAMAVNVIRRHFITGMVDSITIVLNLAIIYQLLS